MKVKQERAPEHLLIRALKDCSNCEIEFCIQFVMSEYGPSKINTFVMLLRC